jgi:hypothetical protein
MHEISQSLNTDFYSGNIVVSNATNAIAWEKITNRKNPQR